MQTPVESIQRAIADAAPAIEKLREAGADAIDRAVHGIEEARLKALAARYGLELQQWNDVGYTVEDPVAGWLMSCSDLAAVRAALGMRFLSIDRAPTAHGLVYQAAREAGSRKALAVRLGVSAPFVSAMINGRKPVPESVMRKLGLRPVTVYVKDTAHGDR
ncbi:hypothetical protein [Salinarimonas rosea]|uniref:hypothetical protein n=1 Tax=Salinarimonas rosea TaxID=552063 RepID=UPI0003F9FBDF|nr:hypothetical protein [Salinarimonas rosea]